MASKILYPAIAVVGIALASGAAWWYQNKPQAPTEVAGGAAKPGGAAPASAAVAPQRPAGVEVAKVEQASLQDDAQSVGSLRSRQSVMMRPEVAGRVKALPFADGARVREGQLLVQLDDTLQRAEVSQAQAQVSIAQSNYKRNQELVEQNFVAKRVLDESSASLQVAQAQAALANARLLRMAILAPFDGTVGLRVVNLGDYVKDGADLINLEDTSTMVVDFRLPERYERKLKPQQIVELALDAYPLLDANGRSVGIRAMLPNTAGEAVVAMAKPASAGSPDAKTVATPVKPKGKAPAGADGAKLGPLRPGMFARVTTIFGVNDSALIVPEEAIVPQGGKQFVIKVVAPAAVPAATGLPADTEWVSLRQEVKLGVRRQGKVEIQEGLSEGQTIVIAGQQRLQRDGTPLRIVELGRPAAAAAPAAPASAASAAR
jgi:membrane fusion protein, multidrug efflux system